MQPIYQTNSLFSVHSNPMLPYWHVKDPGHSTKSAGGRLHLSTHTPLTQRSQSRLTMLLSRHSVGCNSSGNTQPQSSQLTEPLLTDPGLKSGISLHKLISALKKERKKAQAGNGWLNILPKSSQMRKTPPPPHHHL